MRKGIGIIFICCLCVTGCGKSDAKAEGGTVDTAKVQEDTREMLWEQTETADVRSIHTHSAYGTSFRKQVGEEKPVIYLGMPRVLDEAPEDGVQWFTSDERIATVHNGVVSGWQEGVVTIQKQDADGNVLDSREFAVTTFNDGKKVEACYEISPEEFEGVEISYRDTVSPELLRTKINTIQDSIAYFQKSDFTYQSYSPILVSGDTLWNWSLPGDSVILNKFGGPADLANAVTYLLQNDYEDWGYLIAYGYNAKIFTWFYEDGYYYVMDYSALLEDLIDGCRYKTYEPMKTDRLEDITEYLHGRVDRNNTLVYIMIPAAGHAEMPAFYSSCLRNSSLIYSEHIELAFEDDVYDNMTILYENENFDFTIRPVLSEDMPLGVPQYGAENEYRYAYE